MATQNTKLKELREALGNNELDKKTVQRDIWKGWMTEQVVESNQFTHAVTLTMRQTIKHLAPTQSDWLPTLNGGVFYERLTPTRARNNFQRFISKLNGDIYKTAWRRHGKGALVIPVLEGGKQDGDKHLHFHLAIGFPDRQLSTSEIENKVRSYWNRTPFGKFQTQITVDEITDASGWMSYIQKRIDSDGSFYSLEAARLPKK
jgi:hypothetical protein